VDDPETGKSGEEEPVAAAAAVLAAGVSQSAACAAARRLTAARHGGAPDRAAWPVQLYAPLYLSSHCANRCAYCGFAADQPVLRRHLNRTEARGQAALLQARGLVHLLLVAGDFPRLTTPDYLAGIIADLADRELEIDLEIAAQTTLEYDRLRRAGAGGVTLYMETYDEEAYIRHHPRGPKVSYDWRLEALDRAAEAGLRRLGMGILLGLAEPVADLLAMVRHATYLRRRYPECRLAFSLPRVHKAPGTFTVPFPVADDLFIRMYAALRHAFPEATLVLSTREAPPLRERLADICVTRMSAASSTIPGGYEESLPATGPGGQFPVADGRSVAETVRWLRRAGHPVTWSCREVAKDRDESCVMAADRA